MTTETLVRVNGETLTELPQDLYIPPDALEVFLETFEGPLDLLLYLIRRQNLDIIQISLAQITLQYMQYISLMKTMRLELAAEYLVMAATLAEIKSRLLLPKVVLPGEEEEDPRALLIQRLLAYERYKKAACEIDLLPRMERDTFDVCPQCPEMKTVRVLPTVMLKELVLAFAEAIERAELYTKHAVAREPLSVKERMGIILSHLKTTENVTFWSCFSVDEGKMGVVVTFLAILELVKESLIWVSQAENFGMIYLSSPVSQ